jgi:ADP-ribose pyrophosphatase
MSSTTQEPEIVNRQELKTDAKWLKMEKINWKDQDGKEVRHHLQLA